MKRRTAMGGILGLIVATATLLGAPGALAATDPYAQAQAKAQYTVYAPSQTFGLIRAAGAEGFQSNDCGNPGGPLITAGYISRGHGKRSFTLQESAKGCVDGPDAMGRYGTVTVKGATATIMGTCAKQASTCPSATRAAVKEGAYTTVTLPAANGHGTTYVELYSKGLTVAQITHLLATLMPAATS